MTEPIGAQPLMTEPIGAPTSQLGRAGVLKDFRRVVRLGVHGDFDTVRIATARLQRRRGEAHEGPHARERVAVRGAADAVASANVNSGAADACGSSRSRRRCRRRRSLGTPQCVRDAVVHAKPKVALALPRVAMVQMSTESLGGDHAQRSNQRESLIDVGDEGRKALDAREARLVQDDDRPAARTSSLVWPALQLVVNSQSRRQSQLSELQHRINVAEAQRSVVGGRWRVRKVECAGEHDSGDDILDLVA